VTVLVTASASASVRTMCLNALNQLQDNIGHLQFDKVDNVEEDHTTAILPKWYHDTGIETPVEQSSGRYSARRIQ